MKIALVAATRDEIAPVMTYLGERLYLRSQHDIQPYITGVGLLSTAYMITRKFSRSRPDLAIQAGISGSLNPLYRPGMVLAIRDEFIGDQGAFESNEWKDIFDLNLAAANEFPFHHKKLSNPHEEILTRTQLMRVPAITVNEISTDAERIQILIEKYAPVVESMEGAAFHYVCLQEDIPFVQIRSVSNFIGERNKKNWFLQEAIENLNNELIKIIHRLVEVPIT